MYSCASLSVHSTASPISFRVSRIFSASEITFISFKATTLFLFAFLLFETDYEGKPGICKALIGLLNGFFLGWPLFLTVSRFSIRINILDNDLSEV